MERAINVREVTKEFMENCYYKTSFNDICENIIWFFTFYPLLAMINFNRSKNINEIFIGVVAIIPIIICVLLKRKLKVVWQSLLVFSTIYILSGGVFYIALDRISYGIFYIPWLIRDIKKSKVVEKVKFTSNNIIASEVVLAISILICAILKFNDMRKLIFILSIIVGLFSVLYIHKIRTDRLYVQDNIKRNVVSISDKYSKNIIIGICIVGIIVVIATVSAMGAFDKAAAVTDKIASILTDRPDSVQVENEYDKDSIKQQANEMDNLQNINSEPSAFVKAIFSVLKVILNIITIGLKIFVAIALMTMIYLVFNFIILKLKTKNETDKIEYIYNSGKKEIKITERMKKYKDDIKELISNDNKKEVRRLYKKKVLKYKVKRVFLRNSFTVGEINNEIRDKANEDIESLSNIYEKARYSNEDIGDLEINQLKKSL